MVTQHLRLFGICTNPRCCSPCCHSISAQVRCLAAQCDRGRRKETPGLAPKESREQLSDKQQLPLHRNNERSALFSAAVVCDNNHLTTKTPPIHVKVSSMIMDQAIPPQAQLLSVDSIPSPRHSRSTPTRAADTHRYS